MAFGVFLLLLKIKRAGRLFRQIWSVPDRCTVVALRSEWPMRHFSMWSARFLLCLVGSGLARGCEPNTDIHEKLPHPTTFRIGCALCSTLLFSLLNLRNFFFGERFQFAGMGNERCDSVQTSSSKPPPTLGKKAKIGSVRAEPLAIRDWAIAIKITHARPSDLRVATVRIRKTQSLSCAWN